MNTAELRADADLDACREAFPALEWIADRWFAHGNHTDHNVITVRKGHSRVDAWMSRQTNVLADIEGATVQDALCQLRQAMTAVRDDLTAALAANPAGP